MVRTQLWDVIKDFGLAPTVKRIVNEEKERIGEKKLCMREIRR